MLSLCPNDAATKPGQARMMPQSNQGREGKGRIYQVKEGNPLLHDAPDYARDYAPINYYIINYEIINATILFHTAIYLLPRIPPLFNPSTKRGSAPGDDLW